MTRIDETTDDASDERAKGIDGRDARGPRMIAWCVYRMTIGRPAEAPVAHTVSVADLREEMRALDDDPYLHIADRHLGLLTVFDDLEFDRADLDLLSPAMRKHAIEKFAEFGFRQTTGTVLENRAARVRILIPRVAPIGASPFDITRFAPKSANDFYLLTPTQAACQIIDAYRVDEAVARIKTLISKHPVNLFRLMDYLERTPAHDRFRDAIGHLAYVQRAAIEAEPLRRRRALG